MDLVIYCYCHHFFDVFVHQVIFYFFHSKRALCNGRVFLLCRRAYLIAQAKWYGFKPTWVYNYTFAVLRLLNWSWSTLSVNILVVILTGHQPSRPRPRQHSERHIKFSHSVASTTQVHRHFKQSSHISHFGTIWPHGEASLGKHAQLGQT